MRAVVLDHKRKSQVLDNMNEYLHPNSQDWYAAGGIPLRRGYLPFGQPGTGKTTFSSAVAGAFGIDIFVLSSQDPNVTEEDLALYFTRLPRPCIVLLEDVDAAGLGRNDDGVPGGHDPSVAKFTSISLSGLLNAIDGVASHEGHVLIMTTNKPERLDDALIRPGRVDVRVEFTNASKEQAVELFNCMYEVGHDCRHNNTGSVAGERDEMKKVTPENLDDMAKEFRRLLPSGQFSAAEIQGFLLERSNSPHKAIDDTPAWIKEMAAQKEENKKVPNEQVKVGLEIPGQPLRRETSTNSGKVRVVDKVTERVSERTRWRSGH